MNKQELISTLKGLDALDADQKAYLINLLNTKKKYGLVWEDKPEDVEELLRQHLPVLTEVPGRRVVATPGETQKGRKEEENPLDTTKAGQQAAIAFAEPEAADSPDGAKFSLNGLPSPVRRGAGGGPSHGEVEAPHHLLIEGDNLHALTALTFTHEGRVDVIYIDPPYNTGNKDFKYNDRFVDREDSYRHSKWLSFMHKRLLIAKRLLAETGVIFISIDDNEQAQLKMLCDEVFGEENFVADIIWQKNFSIKNDSKYFSQEHEFVLVYFKSIQYGKIHLLDRSDKLDSRYKNIDNDPRGPWASSDLLRMEHRDNGVYKIKAPGGKEYTPKAGNSWRHPEEEMLNLIASNQIWFGTNKNSMPRRKRFLKDVKQGVVPQTIWKHDEVDHTQQAKQEVNSIIRDLGFSFDTPKPVRLVDRILNLTTKNDKPYLILDFFAGSGTTLHATMQLNAEDGGTRQCILVTNNENNIAEEVCYERNRRVIQGYTNAKGQQVPGLTNNNLRYYRCETVPRQTTLPAKRLLMQRATELLCIKEGLYEEVPSLARPALSLGTQIRGYGGGPASGQDARYLLIIYDDLVIDEAVALIRQAVEAEADAQFRVYVFSNGQYPYTEEFEEVLPYVTLCALPDALYKAYRQVLPTEQAPARILEEAEESEEPDLFTEIKN